jgi:8-oxo-dGTP pyrophosphatase MutT (NUDIX family)
LLRIHRIVSDPRLAATVILARPAVPGFELYMTRRSSRSTFVPDAFVFPGGTVDARDSGDRVTARTHGLDAQRLATEFRATEPSQLPHGLAPVDASAKVALLVAALRELFEEAGVLLARTRDGEAAGGERVRAPDVQAQREALRSGALDFATFLESHDWYADAGALTFFSHWITPPTEPRRYDTHFFLAMAPLDQAPRADAYETHDGIWISPSAALESYRTGTFRLVYPTIKHLEMLSQFNSAQALLAFARTKPIVTIMPSGSPDDYFAMPPALEGAW